MKKKLAIITSHPIQYNAPLFKELSQRSIIDVKVFYTWGQAKDKVFDPGFGKERQWDIPLLDGYNYTFVENISTVPGSHHFKGIDNPTLINSINDYNPDAILVFGWSFKSHLKALKYYKSKCLVFFRGDSTLLDEVKGFSIKKYIRKIFLTWVYKHIDKALYVGAANKLYYLNVGLKENQLHFAPHTIDNNRFVSNESNLILFAQKRRIELNISEKAVVFLFAGKLESKKDPELLIKAFCNIAKDDAHLIIVGNGALETNLKNTYKKYTHIHFIDFQNQSMMPATYHLCDVFVLPSKGPGETWGLAVNEAMACKKPVIVSDKCGCSFDLVQNNVNGYIFESGNQSDLEMKMSKMLALKNQLKDWGEASNAIIQNWSNTTVCNAIEQLIYNKTGNNNN